MDTLTLEKASARMADVLEHLHKLAVHVAAHHVVKSKHHSAASERYGKLADAMTKAKADMDGESEATDCYNDLSAAHSALSEHHANEGEFYVAFAKSLSASKKAFEDDDLAKRAILPDSVMGVLPDNVRAVPRFGQPQIGGSLVDTSTVDPALQKFIRTDSIDS